MLLGKIDRHLWFTAAVILGAALLVSLINDVDGNLYKDRPKDDQSDKSQLPPPYKDTKPLRNKNSLLHSVWVIIAIVLIIMLGAIAVYYWVLFYPILCKKERKYDVMQMSAKP